MRRKISQRTARQLQKRVKELEGENRAMFQTWRDDYPGAFLAEESLFTATHAAIKAAASLGYGIAGKLNGTSLRIYAVKARS